MQDVDEIKGILEHDKNILAAALDDDCITNVIVYAIDNIIDLQNRFIRNYLFLEKYVIKIKWIYWKCICGYE